MSIIINCHPASPHPTHCNSPPGKRENERRFSRSRGADPPEPKLPREHPAQALGDWEGIFGPYAAKLSSFSKEHAFFMAGAVIICTA